MKFLKYIIINLKKFFVLKKNEDGEIFDENFLFNTINYFNKNIYVSCFYKHKIYIYNILLNQSEIVIDYNEEIMSRYNEYFLNNKNLYDFLFVTTDKKCYIYELKNFSIKKKLLFKNIFYVLLSEIFNKNCFIISYDETISIIDFFSDDIIYSFYGGRTECLFLWNPYTLIENEAIDSCADNSIINLFDGEIKRVLNVGDFWWTNEMFRIKLKKYGDCLLRIGGEKTTLYYIKTEEEIKKEQEEIKKKQEEKAKKKEEELKKRGIIPKIKKKENVKVDEIFEPYLGDFFE